MACGVDDFHRVPAAGLGQQRIYRHNQRIGHSAGA